MDHVKDEEITMVVPAQVLIVKALLEQLRIKTALQASDAQVVAVLLAAAVKIPEHVRVVVQKVVAVMEILGNVILVPTSHVMNIAMGVEIVQTVLHLHAIKQIVGAVKVVSVLLENIVKHQTTVALLYLSVR